VTYIEQHGHRYDGEGRTLLPNDESEQDRLDFQHHIFKMVLDGAITSTKLPHDVQTILDVGTGTGIWAIEMGDEYTSAVVTGVDLSPIQPKWVPPNVQFELDDITKPWLWPENSFDFIHIRNMVGSIRDWAAVFANALGCLKPGGSIEVSEIRTHFQCVDGSFEERGKACKHWEETFHEIAGGMGFDFDPILKVPAFLESAGFKNVTIDSRIVPVGPWPKNKKLKEIGKWYLSHLLNGGKWLYKFNMFHIVEGC
jgi:SAM-dependent methyltransferase